MMNAKDIQDVREAIKNSFDYWKQYTNSLEAAAQLVLVEIAYCADKEEGNK